jgi:peptide/nickel transport system substrate-binding protein
MRRRDLVTRALGVGILAVGCSSPSPSNGGGTTTGKKTAAAPAVLNMACNADMQVPDPDIFYEVEGNAVMTSVYEGLIRYVPNATTFEPALAESYTTSRTASRTPSSFAQV